MSTPSGFPTSKKILSSIPGYTSEQTSSKSQFVTVVDAGSDRVAAHNAQRAPYSVSTANSVASSTKRMIFCNGINAKRGDIIRFTSGLNISLDFPVLSAPNANSFIIASEFDILPSAGDTFDLFRWTFVQVNSDGSQMVSVAPTALSINVDGVKTIVNFDSDTPQNSIQVPVNDINQQLDLKNGDIYINAVLDNVIGGVLVTPTSGKKKIRFVQNSGAELYIFNGTNKIGALEKGGKIEFFSTFDGLSDLVIKTTSGTSSVNLSWNIFE